MIGRASTSERGGDACGVGPVPLTGGGGRGCWRCCASAADQRGPLGRGEGRAWRVMRLLGWRCGWAACGKTGGGPDAWERAQGKEAAG